MTRSALPRALVAVALVAVAVAALAGAASAHATLVSTTPVPDEVVAAAPAEVVLRFDEPVTIGLGGVRVLQPDGGRADRGATVAGDGGRTLRQALSASARGTYTVAYRAVSEDGHPIDGSFVFHVGERTAPAAVSTGSEPGVAAVGWVGRFLGLAGIVALVGVLAWLLLARAEAPRLAGLASLAGLALAAGSALELLARTAEASGRGVLGAWDLLGTAVLEERTGALIATRALAGLLVAAAWLWRGARESWTGALVLGAAVAVGAAAVDGHAWSAPHRGVAVAATVGHLVAAGAWAGGLAGLALLLSRSPQPAPLVRAFSTLAVGCVVAVAVTGAVSASGQLSGLDDLFTSTYGRLVLAKVALFVVVVTLGWWNRRRLVPALETTLRSLTRTVRAEAALVVVILGVTASLVTTVPARDVSGPYTATKVDQGIALTLTVDPARTGPNALHGTFSALSGQLAAARVDAVEVRAGTADVPARVVPVELVTADHFVAEGVSLQRGTWTITVTAVRRGTQTVTTFEVPVR